MPDLQDIQNQWDRHLDGMVSTFASHLASIVMRAQAKMDGYLQGNLAITDGVIDQTPGNLRILRTLDSLFTDFLDEAGYSSLVTAFTNQFPGQLQYLDETVRYLSEQLNTSLSVSWTGADKKLFSSFMQTSAAGIDAAVSAAAAGVMNRTMFTVGGLKFGDLVETLAQRFEASIGRARTLAETSMVVFYRTATDRAFQAIERDLPSFEVRYRYSGPDDSLTRPFCVRLVESDSAYSREQIDAMNNHQIPNVFLSCGGWNCRHVWIIDTRKALKA